MLIQRWTRVALWVASPLLAPAFLSACAHVKPEDMDSRLAETRSELRQEMQQGDQENADGVSELESRVDSLQERMDRAEEELDRLARELDTTVERMENALRFNIPVHFAFDEWEVTAEHREKLDRFARVIREHYPASLVTVEGFTDPAGSAEYNMQLGLLRAEAVRDYLTGSAGLESERVRAVSYGESSSRLVARGSHGPGTEGQENRRVTLVVDFVAPGSMRGG